LLQNTVLVFKLYLNTWNIKILYSTARLPCLQVRSERGPG